MGKHSGAGFWGYMKRVRCAMVMSVAGMLLVACGSESDSSKGDSICNDTNACNISLVFDQAYKNRVDSLVRDEAGHTCYIVREFNRGERKYAIVLSDWQYRVACVDKQSELVQAIDAESDHMFRELLLSEDDQLFFAEFVDLPKADGQTFDGFSLQFRLHSMSGELILSQTLEDTPSETELVEYDLNTETNEITKSPLTKVVYGESTPVLLDSAEVHMQWHNGKLHLLATTYGLKYYRFNSALELEADVNILPAVPFLWRLGSSLDRVSAMTVMDDGRVAISMDVSSERVRYVNDFFDTAFTVEQGNSDQLITIIHPDKPTERFMVGDPDEVEFVAGIEAIGDTLWLLANIRTQKESAAGGTTEWDVALLAVNPETKETEQYFKLHENKEDLAYDFHRLNDDLFLVSGWNGFVQVDTNSIVSNGQGFNWLVNHSGQIVDKELIEGARDTAVTKSSITPDGKILVSKVYDGPITHTCDNDPEDRMCFDKAMVEESALVF